MKENSIDSLVFDTLIPKPIIQRYLNLLMEHRRIILSGPSGTGKSFMAAKLAEYIISQMGQEVTEHNVASFNVDQNSSKVGSRRIQTWQFGMLGCCGGDSYLVCSLSPSWLSLEYFIVFLHPPECNNAEESDVCIKRESLNLYG